MNERKMMTMRCWLGDHSIKVEGPDAISFISKNDKEGVCEACLLLSLQAYANRRHGELMKLKFDEVVNEEVKVAVPSPS